MADADPQSDELFTLEDIRLVVDDRVILDGISDHIHEGRATALVGPSGGGKTTLLRMLNRLAEPSAGRIWFRGKDVRSLDVHDLRRKVGLVAQQAVMLTQYVRDEVVYGERSLTDEAVHRLLGRVALGDMPLARATHDLSGGERQRLALARALAVDPEALLLDEPTSALDAAAAAAVDEVIRSLVADGLSVVLVTHDLTRAAAVTDDALVIDAGRLVERGDPKSVRYFQS